mmetsp:Transcript_20696/g.18343  ORF Transcript_20696/g.18343 Transcript_20696/m.18343 type:complete len:127 (+) Transcript_20696:405-785(+)
MLIDYEYAGVVERSWDIANYYIETMLSNYEYEEYPWVELYEDNRMSEQELHMLVDFYIEAVQEISGDVIEKEGFMQEVKRMVVLINYYWGAWAINIVSLDDLNNDNYFHAARIRLRLIEIAKEFLS